MLPTGTGKTETLLAVIATSAPRCTLVIVPTDALRAQFHEKASKWGKLVDIGVLAPTSSYPLVGMLRRGLKNVADLNRLLKGVNILVTTMPILAKMPEAQLAKVVDHCDLIAVDEAHHLGARTWKKVLTSFEGKRILQFTATPFRNDGRHIGGEIIYSYPLARCRDQEYFCQIHFRPVVEHLRARSDAAICKAAVGQLRSDLKAGLQHALMARCSSRARASKVLPLYEKECPDLSPVLLHSGLRQELKEAARARLLGGQSKVIVCVDMLGEGFDFPPLKIAAVHDAHKSLPVTLQFVGRFTRAGSVPLGDATVVANLADESVQTEISRLYSQDADWDQLIEGSYESSVGHEREFQDFVRGFVFDGIRGFSLRSVHPKFSAFVYQAGPKVDFEGLKSRYNDGVVSRLAINTISRVAVVVERERRAVEWGRIKELENENFHCTALFHDEGQNLLFVFTSRKDLPDNFVKIVSPGGLRIADKRVHRVLHGINRLLLTNVGLKKRLVGPIRYRQFMGLDVGQGLKERVAENAYIAMLFGAGYEAGDKASVGASQKGKVWSRAAGSLLEWTHWCRHVGSKIVDESVELEEILQSALFPEVVAEIPEGRTVVVADWADYVFEQVFDRTVVVREGSTVDLEDCGLQVDASTRSSVDFSVLHGGHRTAYRLTLTDEETEGYRVACTSEDDLLVRVRKQEASGVEFFSKNPPYLWLDDTSVLVEGCLLVRAQSAKSKAIYDIAQVRSRSWANTNIKVESQGETRIADSIQRAMIVEESSKGPLLLFDDDGAGEVADIVAIYDEADELLVRLIHCKYSKEESPGLRVLDIYELCGQAQKSVKWGESVERLLQHIRRRETRRLTAGSPSRFDKGGLGDLPKVRALARQKRTRFEVVLVQPGISRKKLVSGSDRANQTLRLFGATAAYLAETFEMRMQVVVSP